MMTFISSIDRIIKLLPYRIQLEISGGYRNISKRNGSDYYDTYVLSRNQSKEKYVIIRADYPIHGFFSVINRYVFAAEWLRSKGYIPVLDYEYVDNLQDRRIGENILLNSVFNNVANIKEIVKEKWVAVDDYALWKALSKTTKYLNDSNDNRIRLVTTSNWRDYYCRAKYLFDKSFLFKKTFTREVEREVSSRFATGKTLAVIPREIFDKKSREAYSIDMIEKVFKYEPLTPNIEEIVEIVKARMLEWHCDRIFVSTQFNETIRLFEEEFGENLLYVKRRRRNNEEELKKARNISNISENVFDSMIEAGGYDSERFKEDAYTYMKESYAASKCDYLIGVPCSGTIGALVLNGGRYKDIEIMEDYNNSQYF